MDLVKISETPRKHGLFSSITQERGEIDTSQFVNAYNASIVLSGDIPEGKYIRTSTLDDVLSSIFLIFIFPLSFALIIESIKDEVVVEYGNSEINKVDLSTILILALTLTLPPRFPSL